MAKVPVRFIRSYARNAAGDRSAMGPAEARRLEDAGIVVTTAPKGAPSKSDSDVRETMKREARSQELPEKYSDLWSLASMVAAEIGGHHFTSRDADTLRAFLLDNWVATSALLGQR